MTCGQGFYSKLTCIGFFILLSILWSVLIGLNALTLDNRPLLSSPHASLIDQYCESDLLKSVNSPLIFFCAYPNFKKVSLLHRSSEFIASDLGLRLRVGIKMHNFFHGPPYCRAVAYSGGLRDRPPPPFQNTARKKIYFTVLGSREHISKLCFLPI